MVDVICEYINVYKLPMLNGRSIGTKSKIMYLKMDIQFTQTKEPPRWRRGRAFVSHTGDWDSIHTKVVKTGSDNSTAKRSATEVSVTGPRR